MLLKNNFRIVCAVLIVGDMAGGGLVALPSSFVNSGKIYFSKRMGSRQCRAKSCTIWTLCETHLCSENVCLTQENMECLRATFFSCLQAIISNLWSEISFLVSFFPQSSLVSLRILPDHEPSDRSMIRTSNHGRCKNIYGREIRTGIEWLVGRVVW